VKGKKRKIKCLIVLHFLYIRRSKGIADLHTGRRNRNIERSEKGIGDENQKNNSKMSRLANVTERLSRDGYNQYPP
jgi:hypothetical protein